MLKLSKSNQSGRSMIEAIGYISVLIMISVSVAAAVSRGYYKYRVSRINQELSDLKKVISQRYVAAENYKDVKLQTLVKEKIIPFELRNGKHAFSSDFKIGSGDDKGSTYFIEFDDIPRDVCMELGLRVWLVNDGSDLDAMKINSKTWGWKFSNSISDPNYNLPAVASDVLAGCSKADDNKIIWYFN
ncbi:MAG: type 4 pilus major pilin [Alphaproteobacteria bacterium]|nr:type 4 pilus major pilin [Alphaproteobacteria bacterium]